MLESVALIPLNSIEVDRLSFLALQHLLSFWPSGITQHRPYVWNKMPFTTTEYEVFRYSVIMAAKRVSDNAVGYRNGFTTLPDIIKEDDSIQKKYGNW